MEVNPDVRLFLFVEVKEAGNGEWGIGAMVGQTSK